MCLLLGQRLRGSRFYFRNTSDAQDWYIIGALARVSRTNLVAAWKIAVICRKAISTGFSTGLGRIATFQPRNIWGHMKG